MGTRAESMGPEHVLVSSGESDYNFFGDLDGVPFAVQVLPATSPIADGQMHWEVLVVEAEVLRVKGGTMAGSVRSDLEFEKLQQTLLEGAATFSEPMPQLHIRRSLLETSPERQAAHMQHWLAELVTHPDVRHQAAFKPQLA